jgi:hypothetical protein
LELRRRLRLVDRRFATFALNRLERRRGREDRRRRFLFAATGLPLTVA